MTYDVGAACTTYIIVCGEENPLIHVVKNRVKAIFSGSPTNVNTMRHARDPFLFHSLICHEALVEAKDIVKKLRMRLYDQLDIVDEYAENPSDRKILENLTIQLHAVSQDTDSLISSAEMAEMIATRMLTAHERFMRLQNPLEIKDVLEKHVDSLHYLQTSIQSQKRWLLGHKSRKDIAMNLVSLAYLEQVYTDKFDPGIQPGYATRQRNYNGDCSRDKGGQLVYENHCRTDNALSSWDLSVICIWHEICRQRAMVGLCGNRSASNSGCCADLVDLDQQATPPRKVCSSWREGC